MTPPGVLSLVSTEGLFGSLPEGSGSMAGTSNDGGSPDVFDVANWLDRANGRVAAPASVVRSTPAPPTYVPRHRADVAVDSVA